MSEPPGSDLTLVVGGGPAGLTAAYELARLGRRARVLEKDTVVGGISRTVSYDGYRFDIGGHRFFTKLPEIQALWEELLGEEMLERPRLSRIYYRGRFFDYPLRPLNALAGLGPFEAVRIGLSYLAAQVVPHREETNFEQWVANRFGRRLFEIFFKTYTEKVWGMPCTQISADWAAQRIKNLDLLQAVKNALLPTRSDGQVITTLIDRFSYPRHGPGMMWERCRDRLAARGVETEMGARVVRLRHEGGRVRAATVRDAGGRERDVEAGHFISSMPLGELVRCLDPSVPATVASAAARLRYRDFLTVVLIVDRRELFPDNWIYIHAPEVKVGRVQNFKNWSPEMVPDHAKTSLGLEYFVHEGDELWSAPDGELIELGTREMGELGLIDPAEVVDGTVVRMPKAYPVYDGDYREVVATLREHLEGFANLQTIGRNGQHRYNNQDHSMMTGLLAARRACGELHDVWTVNVEPEYHEEASAGRKVPERAAAPSVEELLQEAFERYDPVALGVATGSVAAAGLFLATAALLIRGGDPVGPTLSLLSNYLIGYQVSWPGSLLGLLEAGVGGYALGHGMALAINRLVGFYETAVRRRLQLARTLDPLEVHEQ